MVCITLQFIQADALPLYKTVYSVALPYSEPIMWALLRSWG
jgi:hypothetical protein